MAKLNVFICQIQNHNLSTLQKKIHSGPVVDDNDDIQFPILNGGVQNSSIFVQQLNRADSHTHTHTPKHPHTDKSQNKKRKRKLNINLAVVAV